ncbi:hypothetical protein RUM43_000281 [Polyplax serrata]|uniref:Pyruvate dehydrogenase phosphatase regulatory subunit, mitochondrial n=1 Tax=Polyplax serrata TaxID=468196 RepID=A0AAN8SDT2_POLSC
MHTHLLKSKRLSASIRKTASNILKNSKFCAQRHTHSNCLPAKAQVVICGGGVLGSSVAYHLCDLGWGEQTIVLEKRSGNEETRISSGLIGTFKPKLSQVRLTQETIRLYKDMEAKGLKTGWKQCGSLCLARTEDRMIVFRRMKAKSVSWDIDCELLTPDEIKQKCPLLKTDDLCGGLFIPGDGVADASQICASFIESAKQRGAKFFEETSVTKVICEGERVVAVETNRGTIECSYFVNCGGFWARAIGKMSDPVVKVPLHACEHYYLNTKRIEGLNPMTPAVRDLDGHIYFREYDGRLLCGGFEPEAKPAFENGFLPEYPDPRVLPEDWDQFHSLLQQMLYRIPTLKNAMLEKLTNVPECFSPDCEWILGEAPEVRNYFVASGMKAVGVAAAGGIGRVTADWIVNGYTSHDMYEMDISRFLGLHNNSRFLRERVKEIPGLHHGLMYPFHEYKTGRNLRMSPIYPKLREAGAVFGQVMGYERPTHFDRDSWEERLPDGSRPYKIAETNTFGKPAWFDLVASEYSACREAIGFSDYSSFTKLELWSKGREVVDLLQFLCSNDVDVPIGSIIHTGMQNVNGGYENDCSLIRMAENHFFMIAPTIQQTRCKVWVNRFLPKDGSVHMSDVTSMYTAICIMGPFTRSLLSELTDTDLSPKSFPFFTYKEIDVGSASGIRAFNITHTGELGFVLYIPNEFALHVYQHLVDAGQKYGIQHAGYYAMRSLRIEKFFAFWGQDLDTSTTPLECGRTWRVKFDKGVDFIGRDALLRQRESGVKRVYVQLILTDHDCDRDLWSWGGEPIYRNGKYVGATTTTGYGYTFKKQICLGFVKNLNEFNEAQKVTSEWVLSGNYEVDIAGVRYGAKVNLHSPNLPTKFPDKEREAYRATRDKLVAEPLLSPVVEYVQS